MTIETFLREAIQDLKKPQENEVKRLFFLMIQTPAFFLKGLFLGILDRKQKIGERAMTAIVLLWGISVTVYFSDNYPLIQPAWLPSPIPNFLLVLINAYLYAVLFFTLLLLSSYFSADAVFQRRLRASYKNNLDFFTAQHYQDAATLLPLFKPTTYEKAIAEHDKPVIDLLILSHAIAQMGKNKELKKMVSVKSILEDREAGWDEE